MSSRTPDSVLYQGQRYVILRRGVSEGLFDPKQFGITTTMLHTGARRGFVCQYSVTNETLYLSSLEIRAKDGVYPLINGTPPNFPENVIEYLNEVTSACADKYSSALSEDLANIIKHFECEAYYDGIELPMTYTGTLRIGQDPDWSYYRAGFPELPDWMYRTVFDLELVRGRVESFSDFSSEMAEMRRQQATTRPTAH